MPPLNLDLSVMPPTTLNGVLHSVAAVDVDADGSAFWPDIGDGDNRDDGDGDEGDAIVVIGAADDGDADLVGVEAPEELDDEGIAEADMWWS